MSTNLGALSEWLEVFPLPSSDIHTSISREEWLALRQTMAEQRAGWSARLNSSSIEKIDLLPDDMQTFVKSHADEVATKEARWAEIFTEADWIVEDGLEPWLCAVLTEVMIAATEPLLNRGRDDDELWVCFDLIHATCAVILNTCLPDDCYPDDSFSREDAARLMPSEIEMIWDAETSAANVIELLNAADLDDNQQCERGTVIGLTVEAASVGAQIGQLAIMFGSQVLTAHSKVSAGGRRSGEIRKQRSNELRACVVKRFEELRAAGMLASLAERTIVQELKKGKLIPGREVHIGDRTVRAMRRRSPS